MKIYIYGLYKENFEYTTNKIDEGLFYIGITNNIRTRLNGHRSRGSNELKKNYINKYGATIKVLYECDSYEKAIEKETFLIKWFGRLIDDTGILANILIEPCDISKANIGKTFSEEHKSKISQSCLNRDDSYWEDQRNARLALPIEEIHRILQEWEDSFPVDKSICKKYNIKNNVFNWWIRKYRPDLRNLLNRNRKKHIQKMIKLNLTQSEYSSIIGICPSAISRWYCRFIRDNEEIKPKRAVKNLDYKKEKYAEWMNSGLSKREFCRQNNINYSSFKAWKMYYEEY